MALGNYTVPNLLVTVNGRRITDWGSNAQPFSHSPIDPKRSLVRGMGGKAIVTGRTNPGREVNFHILPGTPDSKYLNTLMETGAQIVLTMTQVGTGEKMIGMEGVFVNDGMSGRAGVDTNVSDDHFIAHFNKWIPQKGGE